MTEHYASVTINAPQHQVYALFTHFNDFPKFMHFVKEVTYYNEQRTHWVVQVLGEYEWDAVNEDWIPDRQIGWRSISGLSNAGKVKFSSLGPNRTMVDVYISYSPPSGPLGKISDNLGVNSYFGRILQEDLNHFARMVEEAPPGALDPMSSHYLFHKKSATAKGNVTNRQKTAMQQDPRMSPQALAERQARIEREEALMREAAREQEGEKSRQAEMTRMIQQEQKAALEREAAIRQQRQQELSKRARDTIKLEPPDPVHDTLGGRNASKDRSPFGDQDARRLRFPKEETPMQSRHPLKFRSGPLPEDTKTDTTSP